MSATLTYGKKLPDLGAKFLLRFQPELLLQLLRLKSRLIPTWESDTLLTTFSCISSGFGVLLAVFLSVFGLKASPCPEPPSSLVGTGFWTVI